MSVAERLATVLGVLAVDILCLWLCSVLGATRH